MEGGWVDGWVSGWVTTSTEVEKVNTFSTQVSTYTYVKKDSGKTKSTDSTSSLKVKKYRL